MKKEKIFFLSIAVFTMLAVFFDNLYTNNNTLFLSKIVQNNVYNIAFEMKKTPIGTLNTYIPNYKTKTEQDAYYYLSFFGNDKQELKEQDEFYIFEDKNEKISINKSYFNINYENKRLKLNTTELRSDEEAINISKSFLESKFLVINYEEVEVTNSGNVYEVLFLNRLGNLKNYYKPTNVILDRFGNILKFEYYNLTYEKIDSVKIKSMENAFKELPNDLVSAKITLNSCDLVYAYQNNVAMPFYFFKGRTDDSKAFKSFVPAYIFKYSKLI